MFNLNPKAYTQGPCCRWQKIFTIQRNVFLISFIAFSAAVGHFSVMTLRIQSNLFEKKKKGNQNSTVPLKQMRGKSVIPNVIKEKQNKNRVGRWCMRCIYRGWQLDAYTHWTLSNCVCASLPQQKKKNKNKTKERKFLTSSFVYSFFLNESLRQLKPAFLYLILFISTYK